MRLDPSPGRTTEHWQVKGRDTRPCVPCPLLLIQGDSYRLKQKRKAGLLGGGSSAARS
jgi:hypothetical protein